MSLIALQKSQADLYLFLIVFFLVVLLLDLSFFILAHQTPKILWLAQSSLSNKYQTVIFKGYPFGLPPPAIANQPTVINPASSPAGLSLPCAFTLFLTYPIVFFFLFLLLRNLYLLSLSTRFPKLWLAKRFRLLM